MAKYDEAIVCFNTKAFNRRALCLYKLGCYEEAIQNFSRAIQLNPTDKNFQSERQKALKDIKNVVMPL